jgi:hypothetical protein
MLDFVPDWTKAQSMHSAQVLLCPVQINSFVAHSHTSQVNGHHSSCTPSVANTLLTMLIGLLDLSRRLSSS